MPEWGSNILAQFGPFRAIGSGFGPYPGRRCALPWATLFKPVGLESGDEEVCSVWLVFLRPHRLQTGPAAVVLDFGTDERERCGIASRHSRCSLHKIPILLAGFDAEDA